MVHQTGEGGSKSKINVFIVCESSPQDINSCNKLKLFCVSPEKLYSSCIFLIGKNVTFIHQSAFLKWAVCLYKLKLIFKIMCLYCTYLLCGHCFCSIIELLDMQLMAPISSGFHCHKDKGFVGEP